MKASLKIVCDTPYALFDFNKKRLAAIMRQAGAEVSNTAKAAMRASGGGRLYYAGKKGRYRASAPGSAPARLTGALIRSIKVQPYRSGLGVSVRATEFYAVMLEAGAQGGVSHGGGVAAPGKTRRGLRNAYNKRGDRLSLVGKRVVAPRPFLSAALEQRRSSLNTRIAAAVQEGIAFKKMKP